MVFAFNNPYVYLQNLWLKKPTLYAARVCKAIVSNPGT